MRACGATRPPMQDAGWECTGRDLIIVSTARLGGDIDIPIVLPARALDVIETESWWDLPVQRFSGGDHLHLFVSRSPTSEPAGNSLLIIGDWAARCSMEPWPNDGWMR